MSHDMQITWFHHKNHSTSTSWIFESFSVTLKLESRFLESIPGSRLCSPDYISKSRARLVFDSRNHNIFIPGSWTQLKLWDFAEDSRLTGKWNSRFLELKKIVCSRIQELFTRLRKQHHVHFQESQRPGSWHGTLVVGWSSQIDIGYLVSPTELKGWLQP